jgi:IclR family KDG regulon transcriptional repressor
MPTKSLRKAFTIIEVLANPPGNMTAADIARAVHVPRPTVYRILRDLEEAGYVLRDTGAGYRLSLKLLGLAHEVLDRTDLRQVALPVLAALRDRGQETVHLGIAENGRMVHIEKLEGSGPFTVSPRVGRTVPMHCTAMGKAVLAFLPPDEARAIVIRQGLSRHTPNTIVGWRALGEELDRVRRHGYAVSNEEYEEGVRCIGAPILDYRGVPRAAVSVSIPTVRLPLARTAAWGTAVRETAGAVSAALGWSPARAASREGATDENRLTEVGRRSERRVPALASISGRRG